METNDEENTDVSFSSSENEDVVKTKKSHPVWDFYSFIKSSNKSKCNVDNCSASFNGAYTTNLTAHLQRFHPKNYSEVLEKLSARKTKSSSTISDPKYFPSDPAQTQYNQNVALWIVTNSSIPISVVEQPEYRRQITDLDPKISIPCRNSVNLKIDELVKDVVAKIIEILSRIERIAISADIWTKKGQGRTFLGILATFFDPESTTKKILLLDVKWIETTSHTAQDVLRELEQVLDVFKIPRSKVWFSVTDSGSNMVAAFKNWSYAVETGEKDANVYDYDSGAEDSDVHQDTEQLSPYNHYACFIHSLLLCLKTFYLVPSFASVIQKCKKVSSIFSKSHTLTEKLEELSSVKLVQYSKARWNIVYIFIHRFLQVKEFINDILSSNGKAKYVFDENEWNNMREIDRFLEPFNTYTDMSATDTVTYFSEATVMLKELEAHLDLYSSSEISGLSHVAQLISEEIKKRFNRHYLESGHDTLSIKISNKTLPLYLGATYLDPRYRHVLDSGEISKAICCIKEFEMVNSNSSETASAGSEPSPRKKKRYSLVASKFVRPSENGTQTRGNSLGKDLEHYRSTLLTKIHSQENPLAFWQKHALTFPKLAPLAQNLLCLTLNTAPLERTFSIGGLATSGRRVNLDKDHLSREMFMKRNQKFLI